MDEFLKLLLPIFLTALGAYGLYQIEKDHKLRALAQRLRTEIGIITFAVKIFFKDWETKGNGDRVIKEYKTSCPSCRETGFYITYLKYLK